MKRVIMLAKYQLKLLLRNKGFLIFLILIPAISVLLLNIKYSMVSDSQIQESSITEVTDPNVQLAYSSDYDKLSIKILDCSNSEITDELLNNLCGYGLFRIYRYKADQILQETIDKINNYTAEHDMIGCILYLSPDFENELLKGKITNSLVYYNTSDDARLEAFDQALDTQLKGFTDYANMSGNKKDSLLDTLKKVKESTPEQQVISTSSSSKSFLTTEQDKYLLRFKLSLTVISFSFIFCGIMIASSIINEKEIHVLTRIMLSKTKMSQYLLSKMLVAVVCNMIQTICIGLSLKFLIHLDAFINIWSCLFLIFGLGLIFSAITLCCGILCNNSTTVSYICITFWCISCLIGGLYFPIEDAANWFKYLSKLMPQHWTAECMKLMISGSQNGYLLYLLIICAFILILGTAALLGTHVTKSELNN